MSNLLISYKMVKMKKSTVVFAILLIGIISGVIAISNFYSNYSLQELSEQSTVTPIPSPASNPVVTPQQTVEPTPTAPTVTIIPKPSILRVISPTNTTYSTNSIELTYNINSKVLWSYYSVDASEFVDIQHLLNNNGWIPFKGNITLNLSEGAHRIMIAIQTEESRFSSVPIAYQTIDFTII
jgi:hypothetical protein